MIHIRNATAADAAALARVHVASWRSAYRGILTDEFLADLDVEQRRLRWEYLLGAHEGLPAGTVAAACTAEGELVAFASYGAAREVNDATAGEVYAIYALEAWWGAGVGRALMDSVVDALRAGGFRRAVLWVIDTNERARTFYERTGWRFDGATQREVIGGTPVTEMRYARQL